MKKIIIAIDGPSASGKSTIAKSLAQKLDYIYVDSGAMYRAVTLYLLKHDIEVKDLKQIEAALPNINIRFQRTVQGNRTLLNGEDVEDEIRKMHVSRHVSQVAAIPEVRREMVKQQHAMGADKGIVMDGRDIGTVVFPEAEVKIFVTADVEERARRRHQELQKRNSSATFDDILQNLRDRDRIDSTRATSPLKKADDAIEIDNTNLSPEAQMEVALQLVRDKTGLDIA
jgi:cytidylate kinase